MKMNPSFPHHAPLSFLEFDLEDEAEEPTTTTTRNTSRDTRGYPLLCSNSVPAPSLPLSSSFSPEHQSGRRQEALEQIASLSLSSASALSSSRHNFLNSNSHELLSTANHLMFRNPLNQDDEYPIPLGEAYTPEANDVICARGRTAYNHPGNRRFRRLLIEKAEEYEAAKNKLDKSLLVTYVMDSIHGTTPPGRFVRQEDPTSKMWYVATVASAREKVGQGFRDILHSKYRSSSKSKQERRSAGNSSTSSTSGTSVLGSRKSPTATRSIAASPANAPSSAASIGSAASSAATRDEFSEPEREHDTDEEPSSSLRSSGSRKKLKASIGRGGASSLLPREESLLSEQLTEAPPPRRDPGFIRGELTRSNSERMRRQVVAAKTKEGGSDGSIKLPPMPEAVTAPALEPQTTTDSMELLNPEPISFQEAFSPAAAGSSFLDAQNLDLLSKMVADSSVWTEASGEHAPSLSQRRFGRAPSLTPSSAAAFQGRAASWAPGSQQIGESMLQAISGNSSSNNTSTNMFSQQQTMMTPLEQLQNEHIQRMAMTTTSLREMLEMQPSQEPSLLQQAPPFQRNTLVNTSSALNVLPPPVDAASSILMNRTISRPSSLGGRSNSTGMVNTSGERRGGTPASVQQQPHPFQILGSLPSSSTDGGAGRAMTLSSYAPWPSPPKDDTPLMRGGTTTTQDVAASDTTTGAPMPAASAAKEAKKKKNPPSTDASDGTWSFDDPFADEDEADASETKKTGNLKEG